MVDNKISIINCKPIWSNQFLRKQGTDGYISMEICITYKGTIQHYVLHYDKEYKTYLRVAGRQTTEANVTKK